MINDPNLFVDIGNKVTTVYHTKNGQPEVLNINNKSSNLSMVIFTSSGIIFGSENSLQINEETTFRGIIRKLIRDKPLTFKTENVKEKTEKCNVDPQVALSVYFRTFSTINKGLKHFYTIIPTWWNDDIRTKFTQAAKDVGVKLTLIESFEAIAMAYRDIIESKDQKTIIFDFGDSGIQCYKFSITNGDKKINYENYHYIQFGGHHILKAITKEIFKKLEKSAENSQSAKEIVVGYNSNCKSKKQNFKVQVYESVKGVPNLRDINFVSKLGDVNITITSDEYMKNEIIKQGMEVVEKEINEFIKNSKDYHIEIRGSQFSTAFLPDLSRKDDKCFQNITLNILCHGGAKYYLSQINEPEIFNDAHDFKQYRCQFETGKEKEDKKGIISSDIVPVKDGKEDEKGIISSDIVQVNDGKEDEKLDKSYFEQRMNEIDIIQKGEKLLNDMGDYISDDELQINTEDKYNKTMEECQKKIKRKAEKKGITDEQIQSVLEKIKRDENSKQKVNEICASTDRIFKSDKIGLKEDFYQYAELLSIAQLENAKAQLDAIPNMDQKEDF